MIKTATASETTTTTTTFTTTVTAAAGAVNDLSRRQQDSVVPSYAAEFCDAAGYSSACSCWGVTASTTTFTVTALETATATATETVAPAVTTHTGRLLVKSGDRILGYVTPDVNAWLPQLSLDVNGALSISFEATGTGPQTQRNFIMNNDGRGTHLALVQGRDNTNSDIAPGSYQYVFDVPSVPE